MSAPKLGLISATPSPYARKVRITLAEKGIPFDLQSEVPWDSTTITPRHNPLEKLPILLVPDHAPVYESHYILEWLETKYATPSMVPSDPDMKLAAKQIEVVADGMCDALVLRFFETQREPEKQSPQWIARQQRKVEGGVRWLNDQVEASGADGTQKFLVGDSFGLADIAAGSVLGYMAVRAKHIEWQSQYPVLSKYFDGLMQRESFKTTVPYAQPFKDKIV